LFKLPKVWTLYLEGNQVAKIDGIGGMRWLSMLSLKGNKVVDIAPLEGLTELKFLFLDDNQIADFSPLHRMWKKDQAGERKWSPYCQIFTTGNPINEASKALLEEMRVAGARLK
jgi:Leucine-rich repeat (LRR) protein